MSATSRAPIRLKTKQPHLNRTKRNEIAPSKLKAHQANQTTECLEHGLAKKLRDLREKELISHEEYVALCAKAIATPPGGETPPVTTFQGQQEPAAADVEAVTNRWLNADVIGEIMSFAGGAAEVGTLALVSKQWFAAAYSSATLWARGGVLGDFAWPIGDRIPTILLKHEEVDPQKSIHFRADIQPEGPLTANLVITGLPQLETLEDGFLQERDDIANLQFQSMKLTRIGRQFLAESAALVHIDLSGAAFLKELGDGFLEGCKALAFVNLSGLADLEMIGNSFLRGCGAVTSVVLPTKSSVTKIGDNFLSECGSLKCLDFSMMTAAMEIGDSFMFKCPALTYVRFAKRAALRCVGANFFAQCTSLAGVELSGFVNLNVVGSHFMAGCKRLMCASFYDWMAITQIGDNFLHDCINLSSLVLRGFKSLTTIGAGFASDCTTLVNVDVSELPAVSEVGGRCLAGCGKLRFVRKVGSSDTLQTELKRQHPYYSSAKFID